MKGLYENMTPEYIKNLLSKKKQKLHIVYFLLAVFVIFFIMYRYYSYNHSLSHLMYIPIIASSVIFRIRGGVLYAILCSILLGTLIPFNDNINFFLDITDWAITSTCFILFAIFVGILINKIEEHYQLIKKHQSTNIRTGLPNTKMMVDDLDRLIDSNEYDKISVMNFEISNYHFIQRHISDVSCDQVMKDSIEFLSTFFNEDSLYSLSNHNIGIIVADKSIDETYSDSLKIINLFRDPLIVDGLPTKAIVKIGIANYPFHDESPKQILKKSCIALTEIEENNQNIAVYSDLIARRKIKEHDILVSLNSAIKNDKFTLVYQPKVNINANKVIGFEVLLRWHDIKYGTVSPAEFIKIAEKTPLINEISKWVVKNAIIQLYTWKNEGFETNISVNISSNDLKNDTLIDFIEYNLNLYGIDPSTLELELTENAIVDNIDKVKELFNRMKAIGLKISIDDFGTGYNSLEKLINLPIDYIKIDKFFIDNLNNANSKLLLSSLIDLIHKMNKRIVAEGVETKEQIEQLREMDCKIVQGYYYSKPIPAKEVKEYCYNFDRSNSFCTHP
ncbi:MAG: EAL domain-containing protein [Bacillota bacterium]|nr:EAL domain-containing protein [Bacillota bacterium]